MRQGDCQSCQDLRDRAEKRQITVFYGYPCPSAGLGHEPHQNRHKQVQKWQKVAQKCRKVCKSDENEHILAGFCTGLTEMAL